MNMIQILLIAFSIFGNPTHQTNDIIDWDASRKLTWNDFKATPEKSSSNAALTNTVILFNYGYGDDKGLSFHVRCSFDKNKSWGRIKNDYILSHEQGHFDIAELYARKFYKALKEYRFNNKTLEKDLGGIYQKVMQEHITKQQQYDDETDYSRKPEQQKKWLEDIAKNLDESKAYAAYR